MSTIDFKFSPQGVCSREMEFTISEGIISNISIIGGCNGNLQGICSLITGTKAVDVIEKLKGIDCKGKGTSCPDQLASALELALAKK